MTAPTDSLKIVKYREVVIKKNKSLMAEAEALQKTFSDVKAARKCSGKR